MQWEDEVRLLRKGEGRAVVVVVVLRSSWLEEDWLWHELALSAHELRLLEL